LGDFVCRGPRLPITHGGFDGGFAQTFLTGFPYLEAVGRRGFVLRFASRRYRRMVSGRTSNRLANTPFDRLGSRRADAESRVPSSRTSCPWRFLEVVVAPKGAFARGSD